MGRLDLSYEAWLKTPRKFGHNQTATQPRPPAPAPAKPWLINKKKDD